MFAMRSLLAATTFVALLVFCQTPSARCSVFPARPFLQPVPTKFVFDGQAIGNTEQLSGLTSAQQIVSIPSDQDLSSFMILAGVDLYRLDLSSAISPTITKLSSVWNVTATADAQLVSSGDVVLLLDSESSLLCSVSHASCKPLQGLGADVTATCIASDGTIYVGTNGSGLYDITPGSYAFSAVQQVPRNTSIAALAWDDRRGFLWVSTVGVPQSRLSFFAPNSSTSISSWQFFDAHEVAFSAPTGLAFDGNGTLWVASNGSLSSIDVDWQVDWLNGRDGVPVLNISRLYASHAGDVWATTTYGAWQYSGGRYKYFYGPRWIPDTSASSAELINAVAFGSSPSLVLLASEKGVTVISWINSTLESKAAYFQVLAPTHFKYVLPWNNTGSKYPPPAYYESVLLTEYGNSSTALYNVSSDTDDDGIWSSMHLVSQALRYAVTNDTDAWEQCWSIFLGLEFLHNITGVPGLVARHPTYGPAPPAANWGLNPWYNSTVYPGWTWEGGESSDQLDGHMLAYAVMYDLVAQTPDEKARVLRTMTSIASYLVDNGLLYIDANGLPTHWGVYSPEYLNDTPYYWDERRLYSTMLLSWLSSAYHYSGNESYAQTIDNLISQHGYAWNVINARILLPSDLNPSDDNLMFLAYFLYAWTHASNGTNSKRLFPVLDEAMHFSLQRSFQGVQSERLSLWNYIASFFVSALPKGSHSGLPPSILADSVWMLQTFPLDLLDWPVNNAQRADVLINPLVPSCMSAAVDYDELYLNSEWNFNPLVLAGGTGEQLAMPTTWLLPYWLGRYAGYIA